MGGGLVTAVIFGIAQLVHNSNRPMHIQLTIHFHKNDATLSYNRNLQYTADNSQSNTSRMSSPANTQVNQVHPSASPMTHSVTSDGRASPRTPSTNLTPPESPGFDQINDTPLLAAITVPTPEFVDVNYNYRPQQALL